MNNRDYLKALGGGNLNPLNAMEHALEQSRAENAKLRARLKWFEDREQAVRDDAAFCADRAVSDVHKWEQENPKP